MEEKEDRINREIKYKYVKLFWKWFSKGKVMERLFDRNYYYFYFFFINNYLEIVILKVGLLDNVEYIFRFLNKKVFYFYVYWEVEFKVGSLDNVDYKKRKLRSYFVLELGNGLDVSEFEIYSLKFLFLKLRYGGSGDIGVFGNVYFILGLVYFLLKFIKNIVKLKIGFFDNIYYKLRGGDVEIFYFLYDFKVEFKIGFLERVFYSFGGGDV